MNSLLPYLLLLCVCCLACTSEAPPPETPAPPNVRHRLPELGKRVDLPAVFREISLNEWTRQILATESEEERRDLASYQRVMSRALRLPKDARVFLDSTDLRTNISFFRSPRYQRIDARTADAYAQRIDAGLVQQYPPESGITYEKMDGKFMETPNRRGIKTTYRFDRPAATPVYFTQYLLDDGRTNVVMHVVTPDADREYLEVTERIVDL